MKINASVAGLAVATVLTAGVAGAVSYNDRNKEKEIVSSEDITISKKGDIFYVTEHGMTGDKKNVIIDSNKSGSADSGDLEHKEDITFLSNGLTEVRRVDYPSVKNLINYLNDQLKYEIDYDNFKNISNHKFDLCRVESISTWLSYEEGEKPLYYYIEVYYNNKLIYKIESQYVAKDKDGNLVYLDDISGADSIKAQGIDLTDVSETTISNDYLPKAVK